MRCCLPSLERNLQKNNEYDNTNAIIKKGFTRHLGLKGFGSLSCLKDSEHGYGVGRAK